MTVYNDCRHCNKLVNCHKSIGWKSEGIKIQISLSGSGGMETEGSIHEGSDGVMEING